MSSELSETAFWELVTVCRKKLAEGQLTESQLKSLSALGISNGDLIDDGFPPVGSKFWEVDPRWVNVDTGSKVPLSEYRRSKWIEKRVNEDVERIMPARKCEHTGRGESRIERILRGGKMGIAMEIERIKREVVDDDF